MSKKALTIVWWMAAAFALSFGLLAFLRTRGLEPPMDMLGILSLQPEEVVVLALPVALAAYTLVLYLTHVWCRDAGRSDWGSRIPILYFDSSEIDLRHPGGKAFQASVIVLFLIVPVIVLLLLGVQYLRGSIYFNIKRGPTELLGMEWLGHFATTAIYSAAHDRRGFFRFGTATGPQYYPVLTWVYLCWTIALTTILITTMRRIFRGTK